MAAMDDARSELTMHPVPLIPQTRFSTRSAVEAFFRHARLFFWIVWAALLLTLLVTVVTPKRYASEMTFLVQNARSNAVVTPERTNPLGMVSAITEEQVNSELELLHSRDVIDPAADPGWEMIAPADRTPSMSRKHEKLITAFAKRFTTEIVRKTNVIKVRVLAPTPKEATASLQRVSDAYLAEHKRLQRPTGAGEFFAAEAERYLKGWNEASEKMADFQRAHQLVSLPVRESDIDEQITTHEDDLLSTDLAIRELNAGLKEGTYQLHSVPSRQPTQQRSIPNQQVAQQLSAMLVELQNRRTSLLTNYKASNRLVQEMDQQIATTKAALNSAETVPSREDTTDVDPAWQQVRTGHVQDLIARQKALQHRSTLASQLAELRQTLANLQTLTVQYNNLQAEAERFKDNYDLSAQKRDQARMEDEMDTQRLLNIGIAQQPTISYVLAAPRLLLNFLLGSITSLFLGFCGVYFAEVGRTTIATPRELDEASVYPLLATVPCMAVRRQGRVIDGTPKEGVRPRQARGAAGRGLLRHAFLMFWRASRT